MKSEIELELELELARRNNPEPGPLPTQRLPSTNKTSLNLYICLCICVFVSGLVTCSFIVGVIMYGMFIAYRRASIDTSAAPLATYTLNDRVGRLGAGRSLRLNFGGSVFDPSASITLDNGTDVGAMVLGLGFARRFVAVDPGLSNHTIAGVCAACDSLSAVDFSLRRHRVIACDESKAEIAQYLPDDDTCRVTRNGTPARVRYTVGDPFADASRAANITLVAPRRGLLGTVGMNGTATRLVLTVVDERLAASVDLRALLHAVANCFRLMIV